MANDALLLVRRREGALEAEHRGSLVCIDRYGHVRFQWGEPDRLVLPRSSAKLFHALPLLTSGAADRFSLGSEHLALAAASHAGEAAHLEWLIEWANRIGVGAQHLACGPDWPLGRKRLDDGGAPTAFHNNNAGKHLAVLTTCRHLDEPIESYCAADHPAQQRLIEVMARLCDVSPSPHTVIDNCGMRSFALPLSALALGMARLAHPEALDSATSRAVERLLSSIARAPLYFAGAKRLVSEIVRLSEGRIIAKGGSEGIFVALDRAQGLGIALKIADGSSEAACAVLIESLAVMNALPGDVLAHLKAMVRRAFSHSFAADRGQDLSFPWQMP